MTRSTLLLIDRCDLLSQQPNSEFVDLLSCLLRRAPRLQLLLTCRKAVGVPHEQPFTLPVTELQPLEAQALLRMMAPVPASHAAVIADLCGCMPLALRLCGCALSHSQLALSPDALIAKLQVGPEHRLLEREKGGMHVPFGRGRRSPMRSSQSCSWGTGVGGVFVWRVVLRRRAPGGGGWEEGG